MNTPELNPVQTREFLQEFIIRASTLLAMLPAKEAPAKPLPELKPEKQVTPPPLPTVQPKANGNGHCPALVPKREESQCPCDTWRGGFLTPREYEVMRCAALGMTMVETGAQMQISPTTVAMHRKQVYRKLNVHSLMDAIQALEAKRN